MMNDASRKAEPSGIYDSPRAEVVAVAGAATCLSWSIDGPDGNKGHGSSTDIKPGEGHNGGEF